MIVSVRRAVPRERSTIGRCEHSGAATALTFVAACTVLLACAARVGAQAPPFGATPSARVSSLPRGPLGWQEAGHGAIRGVTIGPIESSQQPGRGYGIAESRRGRGHASAAVGLVLAIARSRRWTLTAETSPTNPASAKVLERNGFERVGERVDDDEGPLHSWRAARA